MSGEITYGRRQPAETACTPADPLMGKWYAVQVRPRSEKFVGLLLEAKGYKLFLPTWQHWRTGSVSTHLPLFPGYLFCRWETPFPKPIVATPGVVRVVGAGNTPIPVDEAELNALMQIVSARATVKAVNGLQSGTLVRIDDGPLRGVQGVVLSARNKERLVVSVTLLNRSVMVDLDSGSVARRSC